VGASGQGQGVVGDVGEIECRLAGIGRGLGPTLPSRTGGGGGTGAGGQFGQRGDAPERAEDQADHQQHQRHVAQGIGVAGGEFQVGFDGAGLCGAVGHAGAVGSPDGLRHGVIRTHGLRVAQGGQGAAHHGGIEPQQRLIAGRPLESAQTPDQSQNESDQHCDQGEPSRLQRQLVQHAERDQPETGDHKRPQRPERTRQPFRPETSQGQAQGQFDPFQGLFGLALVHMPFAVTTRGGCYRG